MKNLIITSLLILLCFQVTAQVGSCERITYFGVKPICLPKVKGYKECYNNVKAKKFADSSQAQGVSILGYYLPDADYANLDNLNSLNEYIRIYSPDSAMDLIVDKNILATLEQNMTAIYEDLDWRSVIEDFEENVGKIGLNQPVPVKTYSLNDSSFSNVILIKVQPEYKDAHTRVCVTNGLLINERVVFMAYFLTYEGEETIRQAVVNNNKIVDLIFKAN